MIKPAYKKHAEIKRVYGSITAEDFDTLFRETLPAWGSSRHLVAHILHILAYHVKRLDIPALPTVAARERAVERLLADILLADFSPGGNVGKGRDEDGASGVARAPDAVA
jgi:hypothetical protein